MNHRSFDSRVASLAGVMRSSALLYEAVKGLNPANVTASKNPGETIVSFAHVPIELGHKVREKLVRQRQIVKGPAHDMPLRWILFYTREEILAALEKVQAYQPPVSQARARKSKAPVPKLKPIRAAVIGV